MLALTITFAPAKNVRKISTQDTIEGFLTRSGLDETHLSTVCSTQKKNAWVLGSHENARGSCCDSCTKSERASPTCRLRELASRFREQAFSGATGRTQRRYAVSAAQRDPTPLSVFGFRTVFSNLRCCRRGKSPFVRQGSPDFSWVCFAQKACKKSGGS